MLALMAKAVNDGKVATTETEYLEKIGFSRTNISNVRRGHQSFNKDHIRRACEITGANANWILGIESGVMRKGSGSPLERLKLAVVELEAELNKKLNSSKKKASENGRRKP